MARLASGMAALAERLPASRSRALGMIGVVEVSDEAGGVGRASAIGRKALDMGLFIRPRGRAVYLWPSLTINPDELEQMLAILTEAVAATA